ncbi:hypothetical protein V6N11_067668 [Hibiscus sabdariffa]|uniref:RNase H type-1 domain-containing protein n=1 Tax=Hibiscus sabdariffa TaxID=183260 RepID=A0ABR2SS73_9ROSI
MVSSAQAMSGSEWRLHLSAVTPRLLATPPRVRRSWVPPPSHLVKINFYGSFVASSHTVSGDTVVRDSAGAVLAAAVFPLPNVDSSVLAEALACVRSLELAVDLGFHNVQVEGDQNKTVELCNQKFHPLKKKLWAAEFLRYNGLFPIGVFFVFL